MVSLQSGEIEGNCKPWLHDSLAFLGRLKGAGVNHAHCLALRDFLPYNYCARRLQRTAATAHGGYSARRLGLVPKSVA
jgi:hypothetical protein